MYNNQYSSLDFQRFQGPQVHYQRPSDLVGEGDVISANSLDGSTQLYFVPATRRLPYPLYPGNFGSTYSAPANSEYWYIRSICNENPLTFLNYRTPNVTGSQIYNNNFIRDNGYDYYANQYFQKFHNDHSTSTTDIHYFYPSLQYGNQKLTICVAVQTEFNNFICCNCMHEFTVYSQMNNSYEEMCVDNVAMNSRYTNVEYFCEKTNKLIATYTDAESNCVEGVGRETQTKVRRIERSDVIATDEYVPRRRTRRRSTSCSRDCSCTELC